MTVNFLHQAEDFCIALYDNLHLPDAVVWLHEQGSYNARGRVLTVQPARRDEQGMK